MVFLIAMAFAEPPSCPEGAICTERDTGELTAAVWVEHGEIRRKLRVAYDEEGRLIGVEVAHWVRPGRHLPSGSDHYVHVDAESFETKVCRLRAPCVACSPVAACAEAEACECEYRHIPNDPDHPALKLDFPNTDWQALSGGHVFPSGSPEDDRAE